MRNCKYLFCSVTLVLCMQAAFAQNGKVKLPDTKTQAVPVSVNIVQDNGLHLGRYELYSGIPTMYIGHLVLLKDGKYKVAFNTDEDNYDESGMYTFHADTNTIEWVSGMFRNNNWGGKLIKKDGSFRIEFNKASYAESK